MRLSIGFQEPKRGGGATESFGRVGRDRPGRVSASLRCRLLSMLSICTFRESFSADEMLSPGNVGKKDDGFNACKVVAWEEFVVKLDVVGGAILLNLALWGR